MDASQITKLRQKQNTRYLHRPQTVDSSTLTWQQQLQSSTYLPCPQGTTNVPCCTSDTISYGGQGKQVMLMTGSTHPYPNHYAGASGSASRIYSSEAIIAQRAGRTLCSQPPLVSLELPACFCSDTNAPANSQNGSSSLVNPQDNPYLPSFDTYYRFKNPMAQCMNQPDKNQKHKVAPDCTCAIAPNGTCNP